MRKKIELIKEVKDKKGKISFYYKQIEDIDHEGQDLTDYIKSICTDGWKFYKTYPRPKDLKEFVILFYHDLNPTFIDSDIENQILFDTYHDLPRRVENMIESVIHNEGGVMTFCIRECDGYGPRIFYKTHENTDNNNNDEPVTFIKGTDLCDGDDL